LKNAPGLAKDHTQKKSHGTLDNNGLDAKEIFQKKNGRRGARGGLLPSAKRGAGGGYRKGGAAE